MTVVLINPFEIPAGEEEAFLGFWRETAEQVKQQPGFIGTRLHRSLKPDARFRFVNVAIWESEEAYHGAFRRVEIREQQPGVRASPALYEVAAEY
ncbi:MAG: antibiotic biosynthesis monooxygenase [Acetobacteraceae bacterium]|nr:antibiotic biosynthesis monooxygenase [Acetobacteraceae bacterium]